MDNFLDLMLCQGSKNSSATKPKLYLKTIGISEQRSTIEIVRGSSKKKFQTACLGFENTSHLPGIYKRHNGVNNVLLYFHYLVHSKQSGTDFNEN